MEWRKVREAIASLVADHISSPDLTALDEEAINYISCLLSDPEAPAILSDFLAAYVPGFEEIPLTTLSAWVESLNQPPPSANFSHTPDLADVFAALDPPSRTTKQTQLIEEEEEEEEEEDENVHRLLEVFPELTRRRGCFYLATAGGDVDRAVGLVLLDAETSNSIWREGGTSAGGGKNKEVDEGEVRARIVARYGFVDEAEDSKEYKPGPLKAAPKKLVRYRDSQVVSTKGERFSEVKDKNH